MAYGVFVLMGRKKIKKPKCAIINPTGKEGGNHEKRILQLIADGRIPFVTEGIGHIKIEHDELCGLLVGSQYCNCHPTVNGIEWDD